MSRTSPHQAVEWLALAAAPTFAAMALVTGLAGARMDGLCAAGGGWRSDGMVMMYLLMSAFHLQPWLQRVMRSRRRPVEDEFRPRR